MKNAQIIVKINNFLEIPDSGEPQITELPDGIQYAWPIEANADPYPYNLLITCNRAFVRYTDHTEQVFKYDNDAELEQLLRGICCGIFWGDDGQLCGIDKLEIKQHIAAIVASRQ